MQAVTERKTTSKDSTNIGICPKCYGEMEWVKFDWVCSACCVDQKNVGRRMNAHNNLALPPRLVKHSFENYKAINSKAGKIKEECISYAAHHDNTGGMIMVGGVGTGKTHLAVAMCKAVCDQGKSAHLTTVPRIIRDVRSSWGNNKRDEWGVQETEKDIIQRYSAKYSFLVIDEIGSQYGSDAEKIIISEIINDRYNNNLPTVIIGNVSIKEAEDYLGVRVIDRLKENGVVVNFDWESHRKISVK